MRSPVGEIIRRFLARQALRQDDGCCCEAHHIHDCIAAGPSSCSPARLVRRLIAAACALPRAARPLRVRRHGTSPLPWLKACDLSSMDGGDQPTPGARGRLRRAISLGMQRSRHVLATTMGGRHPKHRPGVDGISSTVHPWVPSGRWIEHVRPRLVIDSTSTVDWILVLPTRQERDGITGAEAAQHHRRRLDAGNAMQPGGVARAQSWELMEGDLAASSSKAAR